MSADLQRWVREERFEEATLPGVKADTIAQTSTISENQSTLVMADLLSAMGANDRAQKLVDNLPVGSSSGPEALALMGSLAYQKGDCQSARRYWSAALRAGALDADLCFRYAVLAEAEAGSAGEVRSALERAVQLKSDFDDARYKLALIEFNEGDCRGALAQLQAMGSIRPDQGYNYWVVTTFASLQVGNRKQATKAAEQARDCASTAAERSQALQLLSISKRKGNVQVTRDGSGRICVKVNFTSLG